MPLKILSISFFIITQLCFTNKSFASSYTDTSIKIFNKQVRIQGNKIDNINLTNYANKKIGIMPTYFYSDTTKIVLSHFLTNKEEGAYLAIIQTLYKKEIQGKKVNFEINKAFVNPEMNTSPKQYWTVVIDIREKNNNTSTVGTTLDIRSNGEKAASKGYEGINHTISFSTLANAKKFVQDCKQILQIK
jgi:hypothetical protein